MGWIGLAVLVGHCCLHSLADLPASRPWGLALLTAMFLALRLHLPLIAALLLGFGWAWVHAAGRLAEDLPTALEGRDLQVRGYVASIPETRDADRQFTLDVTEPARGVPRRIRVSWYRAPAHPAPGEPWQLLVRLKRRNGLANAGGFDYEGHLFREGIGASGYVRSDARNRRLGKPSLRYCVLRTRAWLAQRIALAVPESEMLGVLQGLAIGETQAMTPAQWRTFAATGTTHLMAISGLHISMLAALAAWLGANLVRLPGAQQRRWAARHGQVIAGMSAAVMYSALAGLSIPTQRTLIMLCIYFVARARRHALSSTHALGLAAIGVLLVDPFAPLAVGAWLSFGAVAIILLAVGGRVGTSGVVMTFARVQWAVTLGLTPILIGAFGGISLVAPIANALAVPMFTLLVVPLVLAGTLIAAVSVSAGGWLLAGAAGALKWMWPLLERLADSPMAYEYLPRLPAAIVVALSVGVAVLVLPGILATRLAALMLCAPALLYRPAAPAQGDFELTLLDVGQGLSAVVRTRNSVLVYDTGPAFRSGRDTGELAVLPHLRSLGVGRVDLLVVSHGDLDHRGGVRSLRAGMPVQRILAGPSVKVHGSEACRRGQRWRTDGVDFEVLHPPSGSFALDNDSSCVLRIASRSGSALLTGDIQSEGEQVLVRAGLPPSTVVVVPHHGSRTSSGAELIASSQATHALISAGYRNRWNLPNPQILERWQNQGARTYVTADSGALSVSFPGGKPQIREFRCEHRKYWRRRSCPP